MTEREKLIELLNKALYPDYDMDELVSYLMDNGVTFQKWIPVTERLPDADGDYLVYKVAYGHGWCEVYGFAKDARKVDKYDFYDRWENVWHDYDNEYGYVTHDSVTHWMPLPEPPNCGAKMDGDVNE